MGCDIHLYMEYNSPNNIWPSNWSSFGNRIRVGRNYEIFGILAGVRGGTPPIVPARGYPNDADYDTNNDFFLWINDKDEDEWERNTVTLATAEKWGTPIEYKEDGKPWRVQNPDYHTPSWLTWDEYMSAITLADMKHREFLGPNNTEINDNIKELYRKDLDKYLIEYKAVADAMYTFEKAGYTSRIVFWFDN